MPQQSSEGRKVKGYCGLCIARCGSIATVEGGRFTRLDPDPSHPTGAALCAKGRAAPELVYSKDRLTRPLRRTRPKGDADPGWEPISWEEALDAIAGNMRRISSAYGPHAVAFSQSSGSTTAITDSAPFVRRLMNAFGTPNQVSALDLCGWGRGYATRFVYGVASVGTGSGGGAMPDIANAGCLILWGYNPSSSRLPHATATVEAMKRGMRLIVVDPRHVGLANKADVWLRVKPGSDGVLALGLANLMIERRWFDAAFMRSWTNAPLLVRSDTGRLLRSTDLAASTDPIKTTPRFVAWDGEAGLPVELDPVSGRYDVDPARLALRGEVSIATSNGLVPCRPVFDRYAELCARYSPMVIKERCWIEAPDLEAAARIVWEARPVAYYAWSGHEQFAETTEIARAIATLYALTGSFDARGGNVLLPGVPSAAITGEDLPSAKNMAPAIGLAERPLGPARYNNVSAHDFYTAVLEGKPYPVRGLIGFGTNLLLAHADPERGRKALAALDFYAHADLFMTPTAEMADIVLPIASAFEREALKIGFEISAEAQSLVQLRPHIVLPRGEARSDTDFIFALAERLGLGQHFWNGDVDAAYRQQLGPSGITLEQLRADPAGVRVPLTTRYGKHAVANAEGQAPGFATPSRKIEIWSETLAEHGQSALPRFSEPGEGTKLPTSEASASYPLTLTCAKPTVFCQTQHRSIPSLRARAVHPEIEMHPEAAAARDIVAGRWVTLKTPIGTMRARARLNDKLDPRVVVGEHGWWQACDELGEPGHDPFAVDGSNFNATVDATRRDPIGGTPAHRGNVCEVELASAS
jgi:anaerobic selenocysteine-containing dehydrogenase